MNTLTRQVTSITLGSPDTFNALRVQWKRRVNEQRNGDNHKLTATHHFLYLVLQGKDWRKAFPPITNVRHLANGGLAQWKLPVILYQIHSSDFEQYVMEPFGGVLTIAILQKIRAILPQEAVYPGACVYWPYDAYEQQVVITFLTTKTFSLPV